MTIGVPNDRPKGPSIGPRFSNHLPSHFNQSREHAGYVGDYEPDSRGARRGRASLRRIDFEDEPVMFRGEMDRPRAMTVAFGLETERSIEALRGIKVETQGVVVHSPAREVA
jgi:hypothetical protein